MQHNWMMFIMYILLGNVIYFTACNVERLENDLDPQTLIDSRNEGECQLMISGNVVSTQDLDGLEDVTIRSDLFTGTILTDEEGDFMIELTFDEEEVIPEPTEVTIEIDGYIPETFTVDLNQILDGDCLFITQVEWKIGLTPLQDVVGVLSDRPTELVFDDTLAVVDYEFGADGMLIPVDTVLSINKYKITIPKATSGNPNLISITPNHNFSNGAGIVNDSDSSGLQLDNFYITGSEGTNLIGNIRIEFIPRLGVNTSSIITLSTDNGFIIGFSSSTGMLTILLGELESFRVVDTSRGTFTNPATTSVNDTGTDEELSNCNCADPSTFGFSESSDVTEQLFIQFSAGLTPIQQDLIIRELQNMSHLGGVDNATTVSESILVDQCEVVILSTGQVTRTVTGQINGTTFTYSVSGEIETTLTSNLCPTTSACHQGGCPE